MKGKNGSTPFLPPKSKTGGKIMYVQGKEDICLTERQADHVYNIVEKGSMINTKTMVSKMTQDQDDNPYKRVVLNNVYKEPDKSPEMQSWSIFSDNVKYIQHDKMTSQNLDIDTADYCEYEGVYFQMKNKKGETLDIDFGLYPDITKSRYLDVYEGVYADMVYANKFNENSDLDTAYLGQTTMTRSTKIKLKRDFPSLVKGLLRENY